MTFLTTFQLVQNVERRDDRMDTPLLQHIYLFCKLLIFSPFIQYSVTGFLCAQHGAVAFQNCSLFYRHILSGRRNSPEHLTIILGENRVTWNTKRAKNNFTWKIQRKIYSDWFFNYE